MNVEQDDGRAWVIPASVLERFHRDLPTGTPDVVAELTWAVEWMERYEGEVMPEWREWAARGRAAIDAAVDAELDAEVG